MNSNSKNSHEDTGVKQSYSIEDTDLYFFIKERNKEIVTGFINWDNMDEDEPLYKVSISWDEKIRIYPLRIDINLSTHDNYLEIGDIEEISGIINGIKKIFKAHFS